MYEPLAKGWHSEVLDGDERLERQQDVTGVAVDVDADAVVSMAEIEAEVGVEVEEMRKTQRQRQESKEAADLGWQ